MVKLSFLFRCLIFAAVLFLCDYIYIFAPVVMEHAEAVRTVVGALGVLSALIVVLIRFKRNDKSRAYRAADRYLVVYTLILFFSLTLTVVKYGFSFNHALFTAAPYLYIYYSFPLIYLYEHDRPSLRIVAQMTTAVLVMLGIKTLCWILYTYRGTVLFEKLLFLFGSWSRNGTIRMDAGCLFGLTLSVAVTGIFSEKKRIMRFLPAAMLCFLIIITQYRYQIISVIAAIVTVIFFEADNRITKRNRILIIGTAAVAFAVLGGAALVIDSFSVNGEYGGSTLARLETVAHYWELLVKQKAVFGLGMLYEANPVCYSMMYRVSEWGTDTWYFLEDIGILGGFVQFGLLSVPMYGLLFKYGIDACKQCRRGNHTLFVLITCLTSYMLFSNLALNIFDGQRSFGLPFYLSLISYSSGVCRKGRESSVGPEDRHKNSETY